MEGKHLFIFKMKMTEEKQDLNTHKNCSLQFLSTHASTHTQILILISNKSISADILVGLQFKPNQALIMTKVNTLLQLQPTNEPINQYITYNSIISLDIKNRSVIICCQSKIRSHK